MANAKRRMAGEAISDRQLIDLLLADKYQAPVGHTIYGERMFIDGDELMAMDENLGLTARDTEPDVKEIYEYLIRQGIDPGFQGAMENANAYRGMTLNQIGRLEDYPYIF